MVDYNSASTYGGGGYYKITDRVGAGGEGMSDSSRSTQREMYWGEGRTFLSKQKQKQHHF
jgi:hypothetical protein